MSRDESRGVTVRNTYGDLTKPLKDLLKKNAQFEWTQERQEIFELLKKKFQESPVLQMPDMLKPFIVESDASKYASGAVLGQQDSNGDWHPCAYISKSFNETGRNYEIYDRELLAIIRALTDWRHYLVGSPHVVTVLSDHRNLTYFRTTQKLNRQQARWSLFLFDYNLQLVHMPGTQMVQSDALSRHPDHCPDEDTDNGDRTLLTENLFIQTLDLDLHDLITDNSKNDIVFQNTIKTLTGNDRLPLNFRPSDWRMTDNLLFYHDRCYVPDNPDLRQKIVARYHDTLPAGHPGNLRTQELVRQYYWWPGLSTFVKNYVL